jgi:hypothetical protein
VGFFSLSCWVLGELSVDGAADCGVESLWGGVFSAAAKVDTIIPNARKIIFRSIISPYHTVYYFSVVLGYLRFISIYPINIEKYKNQHV